MKYVLMSGSYKKMEIYQNIIDFLNKNVGNKKTISFITCDFENYEKNDHHVNKLIKLFEEKKFALDKIYVIDNRITRDKMKEKINDSTVLFLLGGDVLKQIKNINKYELRKNITNNKIVIGISAGAINMAKRVVLAKDIDDNIPNLSIYEGLGITDINIEPHCDFNNKKHWEDLEEASLVNDIVVMSDDAYIIKDEKIDYYGTFLIIKNKKIYYNDEIISLEYFKESILND